MYPTNITDSEWEVIKKRLSAQIVNHKRKYCLRSIINAILYVTKTGIQWRMLPKDFPDWELVYYYFRTWSKAEIDKTIHDSLVRQVRIDQGRDSSPSLGLIDSQSVKSSSMTKDKGIDGNKKVQGRKRFILTDTLGLILGLYITTANEGERRGAVALLQKIKGAFPRLVKILADQGFDGGAFIDLIKQQYNFIVDIVVKVLGIKGFEVLPKRWIVERTFGWFAFHRRLVKDYELHIHHSESFIYWTMIRLMAKKCKS